MPNRSSKHDFASPGTAPPVQPSPLSRLLSWCSSHPGLAFTVAGALWVAILYGRAVHAPFVYDDLDAIVNNPSLRSWHTVVTRFLLAPVSFTSELLGSGGSTWRPIYWLSLALDTRVWGVNHPAGFHLTNLLLHWLNGVLLFHLLRRLRVPATTAAVASLLWLALPINTEAVVWVSARAYLLSTLFLLFALFFAQSYLRSHRGTVLAGYLLAFAAATLSHEQGLLLLPLTALLIYTDWHRDRRTIQRERIGLIGSALLLSFAVLALRSRIGVHAQAAPPALWSAGLAFWKYLLWIGAPVRMSVERSTSLPANTPSAVAILAWLAALALAAAAYLARRRAPLAAAGVLSGCLALLPFCGIVPIYQGMAERFVYLASAGFTLALVALAAKTPRRWQRLPAAALLLWLIWGAWRLTDRLRDWQDPVSLYRSSLRATPASPTLWYNLGYSLRERGSLEDALEAYQTAVRIRPNYPQALASIGDVDTRLGRTADAVAAYAQSLVLHPDDPGTVINYAVVLEQVNQFATAEQQFKRAIALAPADSAAYLDLGSLYAGQNREDEAIRCFQTAITNHPEDPNPYFDLAVLFQRTGRDDLALPFYLKVLDLRPSDPETLINMTKLRSTYPQHLPQN